MPILTVFHESFVWAQIVCDEFTRILLATKKVLGNHEDLEFLLCSLKEVLVKNSEDRSQLIFPGSATRS